MEREGRDVSGVPCVRDESGRVIVEGDEMKEVWARYWSRLLNEENPWDGGQGSAPVEGPKLPVSASEVEFALRAMKRGKAAGPSGLVAEMLVAGGPFLNGWFTSLWDLIWRTGEIPEDWALSVLVPVFKGKGDPLSCGSYRPIKLMEHGMKVMERVLERRLRAVVSVDGMQCGFMPGKSMTDAIFLVRQLQEK